MDKIIWHNEKRKLEELKPAEYNPRRWTKSQIEHLSKSIEKFDLCDPIIINTDNTIIGGHFRYKILKDKGITEADVRTPDRQLTEDEEKELNLRLNANLVNWDLNKLIEFPKDLLLDIGINIKDINKWFDLPEIENTEIKEVLKTDIKQGDIFQLGDHRLMCGDSTKKGDVDKLMQGEKALLCLTDPPYSVEYKTKKSKNNTNNVLESYLDPKDSHKLLSEFINIMPADVLIMTYACGQLKSYFKCINELKFDFLYQLIWHKQHFVYTRGMYAYDYEPILIARRNKTKVINNTPKNAKTTFEFERLMSNDIHPTQKPLKLYETLLEYHSNKGDIVYEPFCGSGTTLLACELHDRQCRAIEMSNLFCQVIINRWQELTKLKAKKITS